MFRENDRHLQFGLLDTVQQLPEKVSRRLEGSWAGTFYREVFRRIDESLFAVLFFDEPSRPNSPINTLIGAETLKSGFGWSDEELYDEIQFNLQVRYALGLRDMGSVPFELPTLYNHRQRVSRHMQETAQSLLVCMRIGVRNGRSTPSSSLGSCESRSSQGVSAPPRDGYNTRIPLLGLSEEKSLRLLQEHVVFPAGTSGPRVIP